MRRRCISSPRRRAGPPPSCGACASRWALATLVLVVIGPGHALPSDIFAGAGGAAFVLLALTFATVGALVARRVPGNRIGWIFLVTGLANAIQVLTWNYADVGLHASHRLAGAPAAAVVNTVFGETTAGLLGVALVCFPDGRLPSRRWRPALGCLLAGMALLLIADTLRPGLYDAPFAAVTNPFGLGSRSAFKAVDFAGWLLVLAGIAAGAAALVVRLRRARDLERRQLKLVLAVGAVAATGAALLMATWLIWPSGHLQARMAVLGVSSPSSHSRPAWRSCAMASSTLTWPSTARRLRSGHGDPRRRVRGHEPSARDRAGRRLRLADRSRHAGRRGGVPAAALAGAGRARPALPPCPLHALRRVADFLEDLRAGRAAPEAVEDVLRDVCEDPRIELRFLDPETGTMSTLADRSGTGGRPRADPDRARRAADRVVLHAPAGEDRVALLRQVVAAGGLRSRSRGYRWSCVADWPKSKPRARGSSRPATRSAGGSSATCTTARSRGSCRSGSHCVTHSTSSARLARARQPHARRRGHRDRGRDRRAARARPRPTAQRNSTPGSPRRCASWSAARPCPSSSTATRERYDRGLEAAAYFIACEGLTNAVKHSDATRIVLRAGAPRRQARRVRDRRRHRRRGARPGSGLAGLADRVAAHGGTLRIDSRNAGTTLIAELPCGS